MQVGGSLRLRSANGPRTGVWGSDERDRAPVWFSPLREGGVYSPGRFAGWSGVVRRPERPAAARGPCRRSWRGVYSRALF